MDIAESEWLEEVASHVVEVIRRTNRGSWPTSAIEWEVIATRLGIRVKPAKLQLSFGAFLIRDMLVYGERAEGPCLCKWMAHEVTEWILRSEVTDPLVVPPTDFDVRHRIAQIVEGVVD